MPTATAPDWRLKVAGSTYTTPTSGFRLLSLLAFSRNGESELAFVKTGGAFPTRPDTFLAKAITLEYDIGGGYVKCFTGECTTMAVTYGPMGWTRAYTCRGLSYMGDLVPITNTNTGDDKFIFNADVENYIEYRADLAGMTVGEMLEAVLDDTDLDAALTSVGIPSYNSTDTGLITHVPPYPCRLAGEKAVSAINGFLNQHAPNHMLWINPDGGQMRFMDIREFGSNAGGYPNVTTLTMGSSTDLVDVAGISLAVSTEGCFSRVKVRGSEYAEMRLYQLEDGSLAEDFAWGAYSNTQAKDNWAIDDWNGTNATMRASGTCTCSDTTHVTLNPVDTPDTRTWAADDWDQTTDGYKGVLNLTYTAGSGITFKAERRVTANASLSSGGTSAFTLDRALPHTNYNEFELRGVGSGAALVWRDYAVVDATCAEKLRPISTFPAPIINSSGLAAALSSTPVFEIDWSSDGNPPYFTTTTSGIIDWSTGHVILDQPSVRAFGTDANLETGGASTDGIPANVRAWIPTQTDALEVVCPEDTGTAYTPQYEGTVSTIEGLNRTLTITASQWRDPGNQVNMLAYACEFLDSVKDTTIEGTIPLLRFNATFLTPGQAVYLAGDGYSTGWTSYKLPVVGCRLQFLQTGEGGSLYRMELQISNKRQTYGADEYDRPIREGEWGGLGNVALGFVPPAYHEGTVL